MTRINDAVDTLLEEDSVNDMAVARHHETYLHQREVRREEVQLLADAGHLAPDLPEPDANDGIWYTPRSISVHVGDGQWVCVEDDDGIHVMKPDEGREVAYALLAAADYAEEHANDQ